MKRSMSQNEELHYNINVRCVGGWPSPTLYMSCYGEIKWASTRKLKKKKKKKKKKKITYKLMGHHPHSDLISCIHQQVSTFVLNKVARHLNELEVADRLHLHLQNSMNNIQTSLQNYFTRSGVLNGQPNHVGTQSQPVNNLG